MFYIFVRARDAVSYRFPTSLFFYLSYPGNNP